MWECELRAQIKSNEEISSLKNHPIMKNLPLVPRDAFYGGRTGNTKMYYKAKAEEKIKYTDVCSLYPWVCKYGKFPVGYPVLYVGDTECRYLDLNKTNGIIKCTVLPPQRLYHPILPAKQNKKLMFSLCWACSNELNQVECQHTPEERSITGTWVMDEVLKALEKGYELVQIQEIWSYKIEQYDSKSKTGGLFTEMMDKFIKMKQEASGFPSDCNTENEREQYVEEFLRQEHVQLEYKNINKNAGLRSLAKLMLNSFWGKFGQRENQCKTSILHEPSEVFEFFTRSSIKINDLKHISEKAVVISWEQKEETANPLSTVNVAIAAYTTAQARLKLYEYLDILGEKVLYYDTDSVIYVSREGEIEPTTGNCIGDMTDELEEYGVGSYITEFASGGPKNYAFNIWSTKTNSLVSVCKVKGIRLNYNASRIINMETMTKMILNDDDKSINVVSDNIRRTADHDVITKTETKKYTLRSEKRKMLSNFDSVPYGFKNIKKE